jgi:hypothetical protein
MIETLSMRIVRQVRAKNSGHEVIAEALVSDCAVKFTCKVEPIDNEFKWNRNTFCTCYWCKYPHTVVYDFIEYKDGSMNAAATDVEDERQSNE